MDEKILDEKEKNSSISVEKTATNKFVFKIKLYFSVEESEQKVLERIKRIYTELEKTYK